MKGPPRMLVPVAIAQLLLFTASPSLDIQPRTVGPGDPVLITVRGGSEASGTLGKQTLRFYPWGSGSQAIASIPVDAEAGELEIVVHAHSKGSSDHEVRGKLKIAPAHFPEKTLTVDDRFVEKPPPEVQKRIETDQSAFDHAFDRPLVPPLFKSEFAWPRPKRVTAAFGEKRLFNGKKTSQHQGLDLKGKLGEPVYAANDGVVVMARDCYASGNTVILHHGGELFTLYFHLSKMNVHPGERVSLGRRIGKVGGTGRVTGPHLHWAVKIGKHYANPESLMRLRFSRPRVSSR